MEPSLTSQKVGTRTRSIRGTQPPRMTHRPLSSGNIEFINARCRSKRSQPRIERSKAISRPFRGEGILFCIDPKSGRRWTERKGRHATQQFFPSSLVGPTLPYTRSRRRRWGPKTWRPACPSQTGDDATIMHATCQVGWQPINPACFLPHSIRGDDASADDRP
jgi:hypothetical protein